MTKRQLDKLKIGDKVRTRGIERVFDVKYIVHFNYGVPHIQIEDFDGTPWLISYKQLDYVG